MKKLILIFALVAATDKFSYGQNVVDDGLITSHLSVNTNSSDFVDFIKGFETGLKKVKLGEIKSFDEVATQYGLDLRSYPSLSTLANTPQSPSFQAAYSKRFVNSLLTITDKIGVSYNDLGQLRNSYKELAISGNLSPSEAKALALIDVSLQSLSNNIPLNSFSTQSIVKHDNKVTAPMPRWLRCALGVVGSAILGGLQGVGSGFTIGGAVGGVIGGIMGVAGGAFIGAATFCGGSSTN